VLRGALRRIAVILAVLVGGTAAVSAALGALAGSGLLRSLAVGYYVAGAGVLLGSLALGSRGPMRAERDGEDDSPPVVVPILGGLYAPRGRRNLRKATPEERSESRRNSLGLFALGLLLVLLGTAFDPTRHAF
jgi:hypothetical protein